MADKKPGSPKKRTLTVRERSQTVKKNSPQRVRKTAKKAAKPFQLVGSGLVIMFRPFRFVLQPFKTRPVRFVGRILAKVLLINYFLGSWEELRKVTWPNRKNTIRLTLAVFAFAIVFGIVIAVVDFGLDKLFRKILL
jgi:preprotein translocase SecE subunit